MACLVDVSATFCAVAGHRFALAFAFVFALALAFAFVFAFAFAFAFRPGSVTCAPPASDRNVTDSRDGYLA